jgi:hypothetical protein
LLAGKGIQRAKGSSISNTCEWLASARAIPPLALAAGQLPAVTTAGFRQVHQAQHLVSPRQPFGLGHALQAQAKATLSRTDSQGSSASC